MDEFLNKSKAFLGLLQSTMGEDSRAKSAEAAEVMYASMTEIVNNRELNMQEMVNAVLAITTEVLEIVINNTTDEQGGE